MVSIFKRHKLTRVGPISTSVVLPKEWVDPIKELMGAEDVSVDIFGDEFLVIEVTGLKIKNKKTQKLLNELKKHFSVKMSE